VDVSGEFFISRTANCIVLVVRYNTVANSRIITKMMSIKSCE